CRPWSPVNNCTPAAGHRWEDDAPWPSQVEPHHDFEYFANNDFVCFDKFGEFNPDLFVEMGKLCTKK
ncbi:replication endonuclease, partial [Janthinobacterium sp. LB2P10]